MEIDQVSDGITWAQLADWSRRPATFEYEAEQRRKVTAALAAREMAATPTMTDAPASAPSETTAPSATPAAPKTLHEHVAALSAALNATGDDAERAALLVAAPREVREQLNARLMYCKFHADIEAALAATNAACVEFSARLDAAKDDQERLAIIRGATPAFVVKWREHRTDTEDAARRRYLALAAGDGADGA